MNNPKFLTKQRRSTLATLCGLLASIAGFEGTHAAEPPVDFTDAPIYEIGEIPFQTVWQGSETKFRVRATALGAGAAVQAGYVQPPSGGIYFDSGNFYFRPGTNDTAEFTVRFSASSGAQLLEQIVPIQPIPLLPPESDLLGVEKGVDPESRDYLVINDVKDASATPFNYHTNNLRTVSISGKEVVLRQGHANRLFESYSGNQDIREFRINAEKVVIASPFHLPSTRVTIRAHHLEFQDQAGQIGSVSTVPLENPEATAKTYAELLIEHIPATAGENGAQGLSGGDIYVYVESFKAGATESTPVPRFILDGVRGQNGGAGRDGTNIITRHLTRIDPLQLGSLSAADKDQTTALVLEMVVFGLLDYNVYWGSDQINSAFRNGWVFKNAYSSIADAKNYLQAREGNTWHLGSNGDKAISDGRPGDGGSAGRLIANFDPQILRSWSRSDGGQEGIAAPRKGGPVTRDPATVKAYVRYDDPKGGQFFNLLFSETLQPGADAPAPQALPGSPSTPAFENRPLAWFTPAALRQVLNHAKKAYLEGGTQFARQTMTDNLAVLDTFRSSAEWVNVSDDDKRDLQLMEEEMRLIAHRAASGLDYFGNPPGWVPLLSLEANKLAFEQEIDRSIGILYLEYWLTNSAYSLQSKLGALTDSRQKLAAESEQLASDFDTANNLLPQLDTRASEIDQETASVENDLKVLQDALLKTAEANAKGPLWKRIASGLASIAKMIPLPWTQAVGKGLDIVANFNSSAPLGSIESIADVISTYRDSGFDKTASNLNSTYKKIKFPELPKSADPSQIKSFVDDLQKASSPIIGQLKNVESAFEGTQAPKSQIEAELAKLEAESKDFQQLNSRVRTLLGEKEAFSQKIAQTVQLLGNLSGNISGNLLAMDALSETYAQAAGALDDRALMYLREIGRRARERLLLYHYYVKKAYEYRLLKAYLGNLDFQNLFDRFRAMAEQNNGSYQQLTSDQFGQLRAIYDDALGELIKTIIVEYNKNAPALSAPRRIALTPEELNELNSGQPLILDLATLGGTGVFPKSEENIRIADVRVFTLTTEAVPDPQDAEEVSLYIEHGGFSTLTTTAGGNPNSYSFLHYRDDTEVPVQWGARYFPKGGQLIPITRSLSADSLLGALLSNSGNDPQKAGYFTYLGGLAQLKIAKEQTTVNNRNVRLTGVTLEIQYEYVRRSDSIRTLDFSTADGLAAYVELSAADAAGRKDGAGSFQRNFLKGSSVTLSVPDRIGNLRFSGFVDLTTAQAPLNAQGLGAAVYVPRATLHAALLTADFDGNNHRLLVGLGSDRRIEARYTPVPVLSLDIARTASTGGLLLNLDGERYTPYQLDESASIEGPWLPLINGILTIPTPVPVSLGPNTRHLFYRLSPGK